jgi:predicted ATP-dependent serine protease
VANAATSVFVGRHDELRALHDAYGDASGANSQVLVVEGEAGIGKTTLVERFLSELPAARILRAGGDESESHVPFAMADQHGTDLSHGTTARRGEVRLLRAAQLPSRPSASADLEPGSGV